jgi:hypothetical protein
MKGSAGTSLNVHWTLFPHRQVRVSMTCRARLESSMKGRCHVMSSTVFQQQVMLRFWCCRSNFHSFRKEYGGTVCMVVLFSRVQNTVGASRPGKCTYWYILYLLQPQTCLALVYCTPKRHGWKILYSSANKAKKHTTRQLNEYLLYNSQYGTIQYGTVRYIDILLHD